jgi:molybdate transport system substrate-binding protein
LKNLILVVVLVYFLSACTQDNATEDEANSRSLTVSAASDLLWAFQEVGAAFTAETGTEVIFNFGASGQLTEQIRQGAPIDVFAAANIAYIEQLEAEGLIIPETKTVYAQGYLVIWVRADSSLQIDDLADLSDPSIERIAIANPERAPYGLATKETLENAGIWDAVKDKLLLGENIAQTLSYAQIGEVAVAIVALSLAIPSEGRWIKIPAELHNPINQALAVIANTPSEKQARAFVEYVSSPAGRAIMQKYGFGLPHETSTTPVTAHE